MRVPAPDGRKTSDGQPVSVLASDAIVAGYRLRYQAVGGASVTYLAQREGSPSTLFVKEVPDADEPARLALVRESEYLSRLSHAGIVGFHEFFQADGFSYLVVDYVRGADLEMVLKARRGQFPAEAEVLDWALQIAEVLRYLHAQEPPIIYRDLKPNNLMLSDQGKIVLIDFGSVRHFKKDKTRDTNAFGTVLTASPEHYGGQTDERSDIYCFGATLHYLLTNGSPKKVFFDFPEIHDSNPAVSTGFCELIKRATRTAPGERYQSIDELLLALQSLH